MISIKQIINFFLDLIFPKICLSCSKEGTYLCDNCLEKIPLVEKFTCPNCEKISFELARTAKEKLI